MNPDCGDNVHGDPMLDALEDSIEQHLPTGAYDPDPLHSMLDAIENSVVQMPAAPVEPERDPLWDKLDSLESNMESQVIPPEASGFDPPPEPVPGEYGSFESEPALPDGEEHFMREWSLPSGLSKGSQGTGCKFSGSGGVSLGWCQLRGELVSFMDCEDCSDNTGGSECEYFSNAE
jgi:hypothetical protein